MARRILTTHVGSLARPHDLLDMMKAKASGEAYDQRVRTAVADVVRQQAECGIDIVNDGEQGKPGFFAYVRERLSGFTPTGASNASKFAAEIEAFPEYYEQYFKQAMFGGAVVPITPLVCSGPVAYRGQSAIEREIANLKSALDGVKAEAGFLPAVAPSGVGSNQFYKTDEEYFHAVAEALREEYLAITGAGLIVQIDDPFLSEVHGDRSLTPADRRKTAEMYVEAVNHGLRGIPPEKIRYHTCYGINEGPRIHDAPMEDIVGLMLKVNAGAYSFEAANPRHEHEYHIWERVKLPEGKKLIPGVITHASNIVEHPELIAERIGRFAKLVGRENVIAGADCGFSSQASYTPEVHPTVVWEKFRALAEGARLASERLW